MPLVPIHQVIAVCIEYNLIARLKLRLTLYPLFIVQLCLISPHVQILYIKILTFLILS